MDIYSIEYITREQADQMDVSLNERGGIRFFTGMDARKAGYTGNGNKRENLEFWNKKKN